MPKSSVVHGQKPWKTVNNSNAYILKFCVTSMSHETPKCCLNRHFTFQNNKKQIEKQIKAQEMLSFAFFSLL